ncbi:MAG: hypothetical protein E7053_07055 [Lentisphaerae bacterium]|nr:hypothetical protein [Lentisphaerota bacterium]
MVCLQHPDRDAVTVCAACGKPLCAECVKSSGNADYCSESCLAKGESSRARAAEVISTSARVDRKLRGRFLIWFIIVLLLAIGAWYGYKKYQDKIDSHIEEAIDKVKDGKDEAIEAGREAMPQDSKYKRDREDLVNQ